MAAPRQETVGAEFKRKQVLVLRLEDGVWVCDPRFCEFKARGREPLSPITNVAAWWNHIRLDHTEDEWG